MFLQKCLIVVLLARLGVQEGWTVCFFFLANLVWYFFRSVIKLLFCLSKTQSKSAKSVQTAAALSKRRPAARAVNARKMTLNASTCLQFASPARQTTKTKVVLCCFGRRRRLEAKSLRGFPRALCVGRQAANQSGRKSSAPNNWSHRFNIICFHFPVLIRARLQKSSRACFGGVCLPSRRI